MSVFSEIRLRLGRLLGRWRKMHQELEAWYAVRWDAERIYRVVDPPGREPWADSLEWSSIIRVCFQGEGTGASDGIYIYTNKRPESYAIPIEAKGGAELWEEILRRGLFDARLAVEAATSPYGLFCWPKVDDHADHAHHPTAPKRRGG